MLSDHIKSWRFGKGRECYGSQTSVPNATYFVIFIEDSKTIYDYALLFVTFIKLLTK